MRRAVLAGMFAATLALLATIYLFVRTPPELMEVSREENAGDLASPIPAERTRPEAIAEAASPVPGDSKQGPVPVSMKLEALGAKLALSDLDQALAQLSSITGAKERRSFVDGMFQALASGNDATAIAALKELKGVEDREAAMLSIADEWGTTPLPAAERAQLINDRGLAEALCVELLQSGQAGRAALWAKELLSGAARAEMLADVAELLAQTDPMAAVQLVDSSFSAQEKTSLLSRVAAGWATQNPEGAWAWASQFPQDETGALIRAQALQATALRDPQRAAGLVSGLPAGPYRVPALETIAREWALKDTVAAAQWGRQFQNAAERKAIDQGISSVAPVGIGARLAMQDGRLIVNELLPGGPAASNGQLHKGDQVLAIGQGSAPLKRVEGMSIEQAIQMIRGNQGSQVTLVVASPEKPEEQRVVPLTRQQIIHKR